MSSIYNQFGEFYEEVAKLTSIPMVSDFFDVFPEILLVIPPPREVEFTINVALDTEQISKAPYHMMLTKLKEFKV